MPPVDGDAVAGSDLLQSATAGPHGFGSPEADATARYWLGESVAYAHHPLAHKTWSAQREILNAVKAFPRVAVKGCHASSKTFTAAELTLWWLTRFPSGAIALTTSATGRQVEDVLWKEIRMTLESPSLLLNFPKSDLAKLKIAENHYAMRFSTSPEHAGVRLQGFHAKHLLLILDDATGIAGPLWEALEGAHAGDEVRQLVLCNPTVASGPVYNIFTDHRRWWHPITISAFDTHNFHCACEGERHEDFTMETLRMLPRGLKEKDDPIFVHHPWPAMVTRYWVYEMYWKYGPDSAFFQSRVLGEFPR